MANTPSQVPKHLAHPAHVLIKVETADDFTRCHGCGQVGYSKRIGYRCAQGCNFKLHACCALKPDPVNHHQYDNISFYLEHPTGSNGRKCNVCGEDVPGFVYHCAEEQTNLHPCCALRRDGSCLCSNPNAAGSSRPYARHRNPFTSTQNTGT